MRIAKGNIGDRNLRANRGGIRGRMQAPRSARPSAPTRQFSGTDPASAAENPGTPAHPRPPAPPAPRAPRSAARSCSAARTRRNRAPPAPRIRTNPSLRTGTPQRVADAGSRSSGSPFRLTRSAALRAVTHRTAVCAAERGTTWLLAPGYRLIYAACGRNLR